MILDYIHQEQQSGFIFTLMIVLKYIIALFGSMILMCFSSLEEYSIFISSLYSSLAMIIIILLSKQKWEKPRVFLSVNPFKVVFIPVIILVAVGMIFAFGYVNTFVSNLFISMGLNVSSPSVPLNNISQYICAILSLAIIPAIAEELFFRGLLLNKLNKFGNIFSILISALCFSLYHGSVSQLVYQFIYGVFFAYIAIKSKSVLPTMLIHFANNFFVLSISYFHFVINYSNLFIIGLGIIILATSIVIISLSNREKLSNGNKEYKQKNNFFIPFGVLGLIVCLISILLGMVVI